MNQQILKTRKTITLISNGYLQGKYSKMEWTSAYADGKLLPIRVQNIDIEGLLGSISYIDFVGEEPEAAKNRLLEHLKGERLKPMLEPNRPRLIEKKPRIPGTLPPIWKVPHLRNPNFTGRKNLLNTLRKSLTSGQSPFSILAIHGLGGVGKSQIALEYVYQYASDYEIIWWIQAENTTTLAADFAGLASELELPEKDAKEQSVVIAGVRRWLEKNINWLLVYDNAENVDNLRNFLPQGKSGDVLITSRNPNWNDVAISFKVEVFSSQEAVNFLCERTGQNDQVTAESLAETLGYLPLALAQAGAYIKNAGKSFAAYQEMYREYQQKVLERGKPLTGYKNTVATTWEISFEQVKNQSSAAIALLNLCAFLAPDNIPRAPLQKSIRDLSDINIDSLADPFDFDDAVIALQSYSLIDAIEDGISIHRLVQVITRYRLSEANRKALAQIALQIIYNAWPSDPSIRESWSECELLLPHGYATFENFKNLRIEPKNLVPLLDNMSNYLYSRAFYNDAEQLYRHTLAIREKHLGPEHPDVATNLNNLAILLKDKADYAAAEPLYRRALAIMEKHLGSEHADVAVILNNLAALLHTLGNSSEAEPLYRRGLEIREKQLGPNHPDVANSLYALAIFLQAKGQYGEAEPLYRRALEIREKKLGPKHPRTAQSLHHLGSLLQTQGNYDDAELLYRRALEIREEELGPDHPRTAQSLNNLASLHLTLGRYSDAERLYRRALEIRKKRLGPDHHLTKATRKNLEALLEEMQSKNDKE
jgi:tetratricopeptide (TPR) repeat protein